MQTNNPKKNLVFFNTTPNLLPKISGSFFGGVRARAVLQVGLEGVVGAGREAEGAAVCGRRGDGPGEGRERARAKATVPDVIGAINAPPLPRGSDLGPHGVNRLRGEGATAVVGSTQTPHAGWP